MEGGIKLVVTLNPILANLIHTAQYLVGDYTFKHVHGELDECEFVIWHAVTNEHKWPWTTVVYYYSNAKIDVLSNDTRYHHCMAILQFCNVQGFWLCI